MGKIEFKRKCTIGIARGVGFHKKLISISVLQKQSQQTRWLLLQLLFCPFAQTEYFGEGVSLEFHLVHRKLQMFVRLYTRQIHAVVFAKLKF